MQALFYMDMAQDFSAQKLALFCEHCVAGKKPSPFFLQLINGVLQARQAIDGLIERFSDNWKIGRMSGVDRNVMRVAVFEMLACEDIPPKVSINEAIDIGKRFGSEESGAFINGILDGIHQALAEGALHLDIGAQQQVPLEAQRSADNDQKPAAGELVPEQPFNQIKIGKGIVRRRPSEK